MYILFKNNRPAGNKKFQTYEAARQHARKLARKNTLWKEFDSIWAGNPPIGLYGYSIRKAD